MTWLRAFVVRLVLLGVVWIALAGWDADYVVYGVISVAAATGLSLALVPPAPRSRRSWPRRTLAGVRLAGWFLWQALRGGTDVALRAIRPTPDIDPAVVPADFRLPPGPARQLAMTLMNLMPGTMVQRAVTATGATADRPEDEAMGVELHTLSETLEPAEQWRQLQYRVGLVHGLTAAGGGPAADPAAR